MNLEQQKKVLESMMRWTTDMQPGRTILETKFKPSELRAMGITEFKGKYHHTISVNGFDVRFQILPRGA